MSKPNLKDKILPKENLPWLEFRCTTVTIVHWFDKLLANIERLENEAVEVYCAKPDSANSHLWNHFKTDGYDTHRAYLISIEPIQRGVTKAEIVRFLRTFDPFTKSQEVSLNLMADKIESEGIV